MSLEMILAGMIGLLTAAGIWLLLRPRSFDLILGLSLLSYAVNLLIFSMGRPRIGQPPVLRDGVEATLAHYSDPLPQALVLTAIVIGFAMTAVLLTVAIRSRGENGSDHVDGKSGEARSSEEDAE